VDGHTAFPFQTEDVVWISDLMVTSFELLNRKASILPTFIPLVAVIMQSSGEVYQL
jgi:hypothetical protein